MGLNPVCLVYLSKSEKFRQRDTHESTVGRDRKRRRPSCLQREMLTRSFSYSSRNPTLPTP